MSAAVDATAAPVATAAASSAGKEANTTTDIAGKIIQVQDEFSPDGAGESRLFTEVEDDSTRALIEVIGTGLPSGTIVVTTAGVPDADLDPVPTAAVTKLLMDTSAPWGERSLGSVGFNHVGFTQGPDRHLPC